MEGEKRPRDTFHKERCLSFIGKLWVADTLAMFHHPVSATEAPGYYDVVTAPMDLSTIKKKIEDGAYNTDAEVEDDVALMLSNALEYNEKDSQWHDLAKQLKKKYPALAVQCNVSFDADRVFIPTKRMRDDESTLRKAEKNGGEKLEEVLEVMEKERAIPLEQLRAMYAHNGAARPHAGTKEQSSDDGSSRGSSASSSDAGDESQGSSSDEEDFSEDESTSENDDDSSGDSSQSGLNDGHRK